MIVYAFINRVNTRHEIKEHENFTTLETNIHSLSPPQVGLPLKCFSTVDAFLLGKGSMGTSVYAGIMEDGSEVAVKRMLTDACYQSAENENTIFSLMEIENSPFIVSYRNFFRDATFVYLIFELCEETLKKHVESRSIEHLRAHGPRMIKEILRGLAFLHDQGILHRDLKPSNILVDVEGHMRLADFGISRVLNEDETTCLTDGKGTEVWMSSEVLESRNSGSKGRFKKKSDVQSTGMIAFYILTEGGHPFGRSVFGCIQNVLKGNPVNLGILEDLESKQFVSLLIRHKIDDRPYAHEALELPFMNQVQNYEGFPKPRISLRNYELE